MPERGLLSTVAELLRAVPEDIALVCEAHARGLPEENTDTRLSTLMGKG